MQELKNLKSSMKPHEILLVVDSMTGQDAVNVATSFHEAIGIDGVTYASDWSEDVEDSQTCVYYHSHLLAAGTHTITRPSNNPALYMIYLNIKKSLS